ncbi:hypothetical protein BDN72DRAFT_898172 [Pluteus cervinus]|uniref:Uncharacterized protein n=1 Tax=Pluteus cervinus TaxID=181527 RepID=A0ACD3AST1_9AGAR|nr:hypothetical protein BDN72DRAFT_898172 [Pluteus cervinus]
MSFISHPFTPNDTPASARQRIDEEILRLEARINTLKTTRNTFSPISRLHPELVQTIFVLASRLRHRDWDSPTVGKVSLKLSWVCHSWRELAHQTSALWSCIDFLNPIWVEIALSRTRGRQLDFELLRPSKSHTRARDDRVLSDCLEVISICRENFYRLRTLLVEDHVDGSEVDTPWSSLWAAPSLAPLLVELTVRNVPFPVDVSQGSFPSLKKLALSSCQFNWHSLPIQAGLTSLTIWSPESKISAESLVQKLQIIGPDVETLSLIDVLLPTTDVTFDSHNHSSSTSEDRQQRLVLPKLKSLSMNEMDVPPATRLLHKLSLPPHKYLDEVRVELSAENLQEQFDAARALVSCLHSDETWPIESVNVYLQEAYMVITMTEEWLTPAIGSLHKDHRGADRSIKQTPISLDLRTFDDISCILPVFDILPPLLMKTLTLEGFNNWGDVISVLTDRLDANGTIEQLNIETYLVTEFTDAIHRQNQRIQDILGHDDNLEVRKEGLDDETKSQCRGVLGLPRLNTLTYYGDEEEEYLGEARHFEVLHTWLMWRQVMGLGLKRLALPPQAYLKALDVNITDCTESIKITDPLYSP